MDLYQDQPAATSAAEAKGTCVEARLRELCRGVPVDEVADFTGFPVPVVERYLLGEEPMGVAFAAALCASLDVCPRWLLLGEGTPFPRISTQSHRSTP